MKFRGNNSIFSVCFLLMSEMPLTSFENVNNIYLPIFTYLEFLIFPASACNLTLWARMHQLCLTDIWGVGNVGRYSNLLRKSRTAWKGKKNVFYAEILSWTRIWRSMKDCLAWAVNLLMTLISTGVSWGMSVQEKWTHDIWVCHNLWMQKKKIWGNDHMK